MRDYDYKFADYGLRPFSAIQETAPSFNSKKATDLEVTHWFTSKSSDTKTAILKGLKSYPIQLTKAKLKGLRESVFVLDEILARPDEVYLFAGKELYYYTYFRFYNDRAVMLDLSFSIDQPIRLDKITFLKGADNIDLKRKGTLYFDRLRNG